ncbi:Fibrinogen-like protein A [Holothuria leucospilota]|uniref:Fibrinogen-like protein A n=1 Tax=Holothuria leucospilota TaxID=206669 RepID=A0A9Q1BVU9_HOLLE|nr:Fibrinogen-like protein A [Holothuria leucospilota]
MINDNCACNGVNETSEIFSCYCSDGSVLAGRCQWFPNNCYQLRGHGINKSGIYIIQTPRQLPIEVYCDMDTDNGGWTVFQRRLNEDFDFKRDWAGYESGFGKLNADFWLGNEKLYHMTESKLYMLRIDMETNDKRKLVTTYDNFKIGQASENYRLKSLGTYSGTEELPYAMTCHENMSFSTYDRDNDRAATRNCADVTSSGWWFNGGPGDTSCYGNKCKEVNLNGQYHSQYIGSAIVWTDNIRISFSEMKIRPYQDQNLT